MKVLTWIVALALVAVAGLAQAAEPSRLNLSAAASLKKPLDVIMARFTGATKVAVVSNIGASGGLYAQIVQGQPCDIFYSADWLYVDKLGRDGLLAEGRKFLSDFVVLVVSKGGRAKVKDLADLVKPGVALAVADPRAPIGAYSEVGLRKLGLWEKLAAAGNLKARPNTVSQVAVMVLEDQVDAGLIYSSVAAIYDLAPLARLGPELTGEVVYGAAVIKGGQEELARQFYRFSRENIAEFTKYGWRAHD